MYNHLGFCIPGCTESEEAESVLGLACLLVLHGEAKRLSPLFASETAMEPLRACFSQALTVPFVFLTDCLTNT